METRVLVPVDRSEQAHEACALACELFPGSTLVLLHVINPAEAGFSSEATIPTFPEGWYEQEKANVESLFDDLEARAFTHGIDVECIVELGQPTRTIIDCVKNEDIDHIVMGSTGRQGVSRLVLGSVAESVVRRSPVPVTVTR